MIPVLQYLKNAERLRLRFAHCPICGPSLMAQLQSNSIGVRCLRCRASGITLSLVSTLLANKLELSAMDVYEMSSRGALHRYLAKRSRHFSCSEYFDGVAPGDFCGRVQCQDVQALTYANESFDLVTSTEVFEHVPDDRRGFAEILRVLRPGGYFIFTVPLQPVNDTVERARWESGRLVHLLPPSYHGDRLRGSNAVLCYRDYGRDIVSRLSRAGFTEIIIFCPDDSPWFKLGVPVLVARKMALA